MPKVFINNEAPTSWYYQRVKSPCTQLADNSVLLDRDKPHTVQIIVVLIISRDHGSQSRGPSDRRRSQALVRMAEGASHKNSDSQSAQAQTCHLPARRGIRE